MDMKGKPGKGGTPEIATRDIIRAADGEKVGHDYNWIRSDGTYVLEEWAYWAYPFSQGWGMFRRKEDEKCNFVDADGNLLSGKWFDDAVSFGKTKGDPAAVQVGWGDHIGWHALYGRKAGGGPDLSKGSTEAADMNRFSCGMALVNSTDTNCGFVDASMNQVGPGEFPFVGALDFSPDIYGGRWIWVSTVRNGVNLMNLMGTDGTMAFKGGAYDFPSYGSTDFSLENGSLLPVTPSKESACYRFPTSKGGAEIARMGISDEGGYDPLDGKEGRLTLRDVWDRTTGERRECLVAKDLNGMGHAVCFLDGEETGNKE